jgi:hypothetical protein
MSQLAQQEPTWHYQIKVEGHLNASWAAWFEEMSLTHDLDGNTVLTGTVVDQAALHGVLIKIRDLGLTLIAVERNLVLTRSSL